MVGLDKVNGGEVTVLTWFGCGGSTGAGVARWAVVALGSAGS